MDEKKPRIDSFRQFLRQDRSRHMSWGPGDVQHLPKKDDRRDHFTWHSGDVQHLPKKIKDTLGEDASDHLTLDHLTSRRFPIRQDHPSAYPEDLPFHPDEVHSQMTHRGTYDPRDRGNTTMSDHYRKIGRHDELRARQEAYGQVPYESNHYLQSIDQHDNYKGDSRPYNNPLRDPANHRGDHIQLPYGYGPEKFHLLDRIASHPTTKPLSLYRGFGRGFDLRHLEPGHEFVDHGYTGLTNRRTVATGYSESTWAHRSDPLFGHRPIAMVHVPPGTKGHLLDLTHFGGPVTGLHREHEFLLHRGTHFRVMGHAKSTVKSDGYDYPLHVVHLQVTGQHHLPLKDFDQ